MADTTPPENDPNLSAPGAGEGPAGAPEAGTAAKGIGRAEGNVGAAAVIDPRQIQLRYPTREEKLARMKEIEKKIARMEMEDEANDPHLLEGHIRMQRGCRYGCGVMLFCAAIMSLSVLADGHRAAAVFVILFLLAGGLSILTGFLYRPDVKKIHESYVPNRRKPEYRYMVEELSYLARALAQELYPEDEA